MRLNKMDAQLAELIDTEAPILSADLHFGKSEQRLLNGMLAQGFSFRYATQVIKTALAFNFIFRAARR